MEKHDFRIFLPAASAAAAAEPAASAAFDACLGSIAGVIHYSVTSGVALRFNELSTRLLILMLNSSPKVLGRDWFEQKGNVEWNRWLLGGVNNYENYKKMQDGLEEVGGGPDWCNMISTIIGIFFDRFS